MTEATQNYSPSGQPVTESGSIDYKRVLFSAIRYWYFIVLSLLIAVFIAFIINRYATRIYPVTASIIVKEEGDISGSELLYNNALVNMKRNYLNELYIIKSYPLIESVLRELNFGVAFYREGNFLTSEIYKDLPVKVSVLNETSFSGSAIFSFTFLTGNQYKLVSTDSELSTSGHTFSFNDTINVKGLKVVFQVTDPIKLQSIKNQHFLFKYTSPSLIAPYYVSKLNVSWAEQGAGVLNLSISGSQPEKEKDFLEGFIKHYQQFDLDKKNEIASKTIDFISGQLADIADSLKKVETQLQRFKDRHIVTELGVEATRLNAKIEELEFQRTQSILASNYYKYLTDYLSKDENLDQVILPSSVGVSDPILTELVSQLIDRQMTLKMFSRNENPKVIEARQKINQLRRDIVESVNNLKATDKIKLDYLNKQIGEVEKQLGYLPVAERQLVSIQRNYTLLENLYVFLLQRRSEAAITQASNTSDILVVNPPMAGRAISPRSMRNYIMAAFLGLAIPLLVFVAMEFLNTRIQSREDIEKITGIPFIGGVGHKRAETNLEVLTSPKTAIAESFRALRSNLKYFLGKKENVVIVVTSSISGEGKTFTSINLASVLSLSGKRVLMVGADLRRPKTHIDFGLPNEIGLSTYLSGLNDWKEVVQKTQHIGLDLISGGPVPPNPGELLLSSSLEKFVNEAKLEYDYVVIDTPPIAIVADAFSLISFADHTLFLVRQNYTPKDLLKTTQELFITGKFSNVSIVLNDINRSGPGYGNGAYGYGYGYGYGKRSKDGYGYYTG